MNFLTSAIGFEGRDTVGRRRMVRPQWTRALHYSSQSLDTLHERLDFNRGLFAVGQHGGELLGSSHVSQ